jgi:hypothetical protein
MPSFEAVMKTEDRRECLSEAQQRRAVKYTEDHTDLDVSTYAKRRQTAAEMLKVGLDALGHDKLVETLKETTESYFFCPDTRKEARRQLELHTRTCLTCAAAARLQQPLVTDNSLGDDAPVPLNEGEDLGVVDPGSVVEGSENPIAA